MLSGDINPNPGPIKNPCKLCLKAVRKKVIFCQNCDSWYHKKCELPKDNVKYKKMLEHCLHRPLLYTCQSCSHKPLTQNNQNPLQNLPFFLDQNILETTNDVNDITKPLEEHVIVDNNPNSTDASNFTQFQNRGLHFIHININSVLSKIEELKIIAAKTKAAVIGISESKLDASVLDGEIQIPGYNVIRADRNRHGGGVMCYIRNDLCFNQRENFSNEFENIFIDILLPKTKPILIGIIYRPPDQSGFLNNLSNAINNTANFDNQEVYILGDFNLNLQYSERCTPNGIKRYREFCAVHGLKQLIKSPTRITKNTSTILDHILTNSEDKIFQKGTIDTGLSDHQLIYCTRKKCREKTHNKTNIKYRSLKYYTPAILIEK